MIICPNCHHKEYPGTLFCSECGARLISLDYLTTMSLQRPPGEKNGESKVKESIDLSSEAAENEANLSTKTEIELSLLVVDVNQKIQLTGRNEYTLGRVAEGQPILPDIDLTPYDAYAQGVSRLHAALKIIRNRVVIMDLGSSNGTRVNGQKIVPHVDYPLNHGDVLALGKLKLQIVIQ